MFRLHAAGVLAMLAVAAASPLTKASAHDVKAGDLVIQAPWSRATPPGAQVGGGYLTIVNKGAVADRLVGGSVEAAAGFEIHDMSMKGDVMSMNRLDGLDIPAGGSVTLSPGGKHLMFTGLAHALKKGQQVKGTLVFEKAGTVAVEYDVESIAAKGPAAAKPGHAMPGMDMN